MGPVPRVSARAGKGASIPADESAMPLSSTPQVPSVRPGFESRSAAGEVVRSGQAGSTVQRLGTVDRESGEPAVEWRPVDQPLRVIGPGRQERQLRGQIESLEGELALANEHQAHAERSLEVAQLVERGTARFVDRVENEIELAHQQIRRLATALGALTAENETLHAQLGTQRRLVQRLESAERSKPRRSWRRWFR